MSEPKDFTEIPRPTPMLNRLVWVGCWQRMALIIKETEILYKKNPTPVKDGGFICKLVAMNGDGNLVKCIDKRCNSHCAICSYYRNIKHNNPDIFVLTEAEIEFYMSEGMLCKELAELHRKSIKDYPEKKTAKAITKFK
jgi:hypothetical protein